MAEYTIQIVKKVLDSIPLVLPLNSNFIRNALKKEFDYSNVNVMEADELQDKTPEGKPVFMPLEFEELSYTDDTGYKVSLKGLYIPCVIVELSMAKNVVKTPIAGSKKRGPVFEHVGFNGWQISIKGMLIGEGQTYPEDEVKKLRYYMDAPVDFGINHRLLFNNGIYRMVVENFDLPNKQGFTNVQPFSISGWSDEPFELVLNSEQEARA